MESENGVVEHDKENLVTHTDINESNIYKTQSDLKRACDVSFVNQRCTNAKKISDSIHTLTQMIRSIRVYSFLRIILICIGIYFILCFCTILSQLIQGLGGLQSTLHLLTTCSDIQYTRLAHDNQSPQYVIDEPFREVCCTSATDCVSHTVPDITEPWIQPNSIICPWDNQICPSYLARFTIHLRSIFFISLGTILLLIVYSTILVWQMVKSYFLTRAQPSNAHSPINVAKSNTDILYTQTSVNGISFDMFDTSKHSQCTSHPARPRLDALQTCQQLLLSWENAANELANSKTRR